MSATGGEWARWSSKTIKDGSSAKTRRGRTAERNCAAKLATGAAKTPSAIPTTPSKVDPRGTLEDARMAATTIRCAAKIAVSCRKGYTRGDFPGADGRLASFKQTYIQWNTSQHLWDCCGDYHCDGNYTSETFTAKSPAEWEAIPQKGNLGPDTSSSSPGDELSTGAIAGIAVACGAALIAVVTLIAVCCIRRRKPANKQWTGGNKGTYAKLGPQHEMQPQPYAGPSGARSASPMPRSRDVSPAPASRGASPSRSPLVQGYGDGPPAYPDRLAATKDDGA